MDKILRFQKDDKVVFLNKRAMRSFIQINKKKKQMGLVTGSILSLFAVMAIFNTKINNESRILALKEQKQARGIASIPALMEVENKAAQVQVINNIKNSINNAELAFGKKASKKEQFLKAYLNGNYEYQDQGKNRIFLKYNQGEKHKANNMNSLLLNLVDSFYDGNINEIEKVSQADTKSHFRIKSDKGVKSDIVILHSAKREIQSIEMK